MSAMVPFFQWCDDTMISQAIRNSRVAFPIIENFHLFALTVLLGSLVVLALRQFGLVYKTQAISEVADALRPWNRWSLAVMLSSGILLFFVRSHEMLRQHFVSGQNAVLVRRAVVSVHNLQSHRGVGRQGRAHGRKDRRCRCAVPVVWRRPCRPGHWFSRLDAEPTHAVSSANCFNLDDRSAPLQTYWNNIFWPSQPRPRRRSDLHA